MSNKIKRFAVELALFVVLIIFDQFTKYLAVMKLKDSRGVDIIRGVLKLYYLPNGNSGAAFGMLQGCQTFFVIIAIVVVAAIGYILYNMPEDKKFRIVSLMLVFIAAGGIGNMIDRFKQNYVVDFIYFCLIDFPIFNVADIYVSVCTIALALYMIFALKEDDMKKLEDAMKAPIHRKNK